MNNYIFIVEMALVFGLVLGFAVWELVKLHRDEKREKKRED
ncbi:MAG: hypothetical protein ACXIVL_02010 [Oceanicaulis sp.]